MTSNANRFGLVLSSIGAVAMLMWALTPRNPYSYFELLRVVVCVVSGYLAVNLYRLKSEGFAWGLGVTAALYNPFLPVHLARAVWEPVNVATIFLLVVACVRASQKDESETRRE